MDYTAAILMLRYGAASLLHQLEAIPEDRRDWKPAPTAKSALEIVGEVTRAIRMYLPVARNTDWDPPVYFHPATLEEARELLTAAVDDYVAALEAAGPELEIPREMPFGGVFRASHAALYPAIEVQHHHGQLCYIQSLLGDEEMHWCWPAVDQAFTYHD
jgi:hypothetical protein